MARNWTFQVRLSSAASCCTSLREPRSAACCRSIIFWRSNQMTSLWIVEYYRCQEVLRMAVIAIVAPLSRWAKRLAVNDFGIEFNAGWPVTVKQ